MPRTNQPRDTTSAPTSARSATAHSQVRDRSGRFAYERHGASNRRYLGQWERHDSHLLGDTARRFADGEGDDMIDLDAWLNDAPRD